MPSEIDIYVNLVDSQINLFQFILILSDLFSNYLPNNLHVCVCEHVRMSTCTHVLEFRKQMKS